MPSYQIVGANIDTLLINVKGNLPDGLADELDALKELSQETEEDVATSWAFAGETLFIRAHGSGRQWRWVLHCPSLHLDVGAGKLNGIIGKARLASAYLWEQGPDVALAHLYDFLAGFYGEGFSLQVSEVHLCADIAGWELALEDADAFITRGHNKVTHTTSAQNSEADESAYTLPAVDVNLSGRRCTGFEFSKGAAHSCCIFDKTTEITKSRKDWMQVVWLTNGWDGASRVTRVEFRYERECLREMGIDDPYAMLDELPALWAYSSMQWLRHTVRTQDTNRGRWPLSPFWQAIVQADFFGEGVPAVRERKHTGNLSLICRMLAGCSTTAAAYLSGQLPDWDDGANFLTWFYDWMADYYGKKGLSFYGQRDSKRLHLGIVTAANATAA
jgi:hypothetical protein